MCVCVYISLLSSADTLFQSECGGRILTERRRDRWRIGAVQSLIISMTYSVSYNVQVRDVEIFGFFLAIYMIYGSKITGASRGV